MFKVLVTGGSGFIGTNLITNLLKDNFQVLSVDIALPANHDHLSKWEMLDILNYRELEKTALAFDPHFIVHLAAVTDLNGKTSNYYHTNVEGTQNVIKVAEKLPRLKKIVFASSMYVCKPGDVPADYKTFNPHTLYGESKVEGERLVNEIKDANYKWVIIRPTSIWGPWFKIPYVDFLMWFTKVNL
ncbi:NAD(P)-dependent oxidoreductase [Mucilaginibacter sp. 21P]|uniref:NAD-dependent epimerase/dehydratase family protein n=1 Tax=Mucilaginibacter sp. 21P TaxID=2778902 RepID=UPI001C590B78|nr:NAD(P)-dependent oxidoreductase [Mucilaginibacter sp. 21P]QXV64862.1 NAD(P)-dependent oxidoreductase [Mucilaginibacter sp. 21P]